MPKIPSKGIPTKATWSLKQIALDHPYVRQIMAQCLGTVAVHPSENESEKGKGYWGVTHVPTGLRLAVVATEGDAKRIGEFLGGNPSLSLAGDSREVILAKLPSWVPAWCIACSQEKAWVDPARTNSVRTALDLAWGKYLQARKGDAKEAWEEYTRTLVEKGILEKIIGESHGK